MSLRKEIEKSLLYWDEELDERALYYQSKDILEIIEKRIDEMPPLDYEGGIYTKQSLQQVEKYIIKRVKEILK